MKTLLSLLFLILPFMMLAQEEDLLLEPTEEQKEYFTTIEFGRMLDTGLTSNIEDVTFITISKNLKWKENVSLGLELSYFEFVMGHDVISSSSLNISNTYNSTNTSTETQQTPHDHNGNAYGHDHDATDITNITDINYTNNYNYQFTEFQLGGDKISAMSIGLNIMGKKSIIEDSLDIYGKISIGLLFSSDYLPEIGTKVNFIETIKIGAIAPISDRSHFNFGIGLTHISNAGIMGRDNPGINFVSASLGLNFNF